MSETEEPKPAPDPGNSPPEDWTENLSQDEIDEVASRLNRESPPKSEGGV
jgi:hypothetical protein